MRARKIVAMLHDRVSCPAEGGRHGFLANPANCVKENASRLHSMRHILKAIPSFRNIATVSTYSAGFMLVCICLLCGCSSKFSLQKDRLWRERQSPETLPAESRFNGKFDIVWEVDFGAKAIAPLAVGSDYIAVPTSRDKIRFFDLQSGRSAGRHRIKGSAQSGFLIVDSIAVAVSSPPRNRLVCRNMHNRDELWNGRVKDIAGGSITTGNRLIVSSGSDGVSCYDLTTGSVVWTFVTEGLCKAAPIVAGETVIQPTDKGIIVGIAMKDGSQQYELSMPSPIESPVVLGDKAYVADIAGNLTAFDPANGSVAWTSSVHEPTWSSPAVDGSHVVIATRTGKIIALDVLNGSILWDYSATDVFKAAPALCDGVVVVGTLTGKLISLGIDDGRKIDERQLDGPVAVAPVYEQGRLLVATNGGTLICFGTGSVLSGEGK